MRFAQALTVLFVALKLTGVIDWSWWWVLSPELIALGLLVVFAVAVSLAERGKS